MYMQEGMKMRLKALEAALDDMEAWLLTGMRIGCHVTSMYTMHGCQNHPVGWASPDGFSQASYHVHGAAPYMLLHCFLLHA